MKHLKIKRTQLDFTDYIKRPATEGDFEKLIKEDAIIYDINYPEKPLLLYFHFKDDTSGVRQAVQDIPYETSKRSGGLVTTSRIFGFDPATGIRKFWCASTALARNNPREHQIIVDFGEQIAKIYKQYLPDTYVSHEQITFDKVKPNWRLTNTPFTSGIINKNNQLNYHFDSGNFKDVYSNMIVFKNNTSGGYLSLPEFNIGLQCADNTVVMFDGQKMLHGVTPINHYPGNAYRYSIVFYSLASFWKCDDITEEIAKVRNRRAKIEKANLNR